MSDHTWSEENLTTYAAGGLTPEERERFERHGAECGACAAALAEWRGMEEKLDTLFAEVRPQAGLEDRMIEVLRKAPLPRRFWRSTFARFAMSAAAVIMLGFIGAGLSVFAERFELPFPGEWGELAWNGRTVSDNKLKEAPITMYNGMPPAHPKLGNGESDSGEAAGLMKEYSRLMREGNFKGARLAALKAKELDPDNVAADAGLNIATIRERERLHGRGVDRKEGIFLQSLDANEHPKSSTFVSGLTPNGTFTPDLNTPIQTRMETLDHLGRELKRRGVANKDADKPADVGIADGSVRTPEVTKFGVIAGKERLKSGGQESRVYPVGDLVMPLQDQSPSSTVSDQGKLKGAGQELRVQERLGELKRDLAEEFRAGRPSNQPVDGTPPSRLAVRQPPAPFTEGMPERMAPGGSAPANYGYFGRFADKDIDKRSGVKKPVEIFERTREKQAKELDKKVEHRFGTDKQPPLSLFGPGNFNSQVAEAGKPGKSDLTRKIIRTGDIEFEVDSFDKAVERINTLIDATKGAFVATTNSDKLPNGKVKGSVVVRMPPERLDKFLLDLRKDLGKIGELKSQRIGSQDITKQYTDIESRLKAARTMEERLLKIIQSGKGEIKDLVAAERELGTWRTKIEEMEGEIRYYNNQVSLSTLTVTLYEKEIRAPSALVVTERVTMRIETEDVEKSQQSALKAVAEAKGRVTKSELKQHAAGQLEAIVHAEVAPAAADGLRAAFKLLGIVTKLDSDRLQQAEGGSGNLLDIKTRQNDVQFYLTLYNVANIQPRETFNIQVATLDVPAGFRKLQDAVTKAKGQVRKGQLNEQDKLNISADFDFDVPSGERKSVDKALEDTGRILSRSTAQAPPGDAVTDSKVGYRLVLRSVSAIPARERVTLAIEVRNAKETAAEFKDLVRAQKGLVQADRSKREPDGTVTAILLFDVPLPAKDDLVKKFEAAGNVKIEQNTENAQVPNNDLATAHIDVTLSSTGPIVPSDSGLWPQIRKSLFYSFTVLSWSVMFIILGLCVVVPWAVLIWGGYRLVKRMRRA